MNRKLLWPLLAAAFAFSATTHAGEGDRAGDRSETYLLSNKATNEKARISAEDLSKMTQGEVRKIDGNKVTIKHSSPDLSTSAMVMTFDVANTALLENYKAGDKVNFTAVQQNGKLVVTAIQLL